MKKLLLIPLFLVLCSNSALALYDFMEPPDEYERFKEFYDLRTEYWRNIPNYVYDQDEPAIKYKNINRTHSEKKVIKKEENSQGDVIIIQ